MAKSNQDKFHGWHSLIGAMLTYGGISGTLTYAYGVFLPVMSQEFGWSRSFLSGPYTLLMMMGGFLGPLAGLAIGRFGVRKIVVFFNIIVVLGLLGLSRMTEPWQLYLFFGLMGGLGMGFAEYLSVTTIINNWFVRHRSLAMGLLFASWGIAGFLFPPMISCFISGAGWRMSWVFLAAIHLILAVILAGIMIRNTPEELGQVPDGAKKSLWPDRVGFLSTGTTYSTPVDWTLGEALRSPVLWLLIGIVSIVFFVSTLLSAHQVAYLLDLKYSPMVSASAFGLMLGTSIVGRVLSGVLGMRFSGRYLAMFFLTLLCLGVVFLIAAREIIFVYLYAIFVGIGMGGMIVLAPSLIGAYFGRTNYPRISGWTMPVATVAFASAPVAAGYLYDITGTYLLPFGITAGLLFICVILAFFARPPQKKELENKRV